MTPAMADCAVVVFAKAPIAGQVKTRMLPGLSAAQAAALHARMLARAVDTAARAALGPLTLCCAPDAGHPAFRALADRHGAALTVQRGADLGQRMLRALEDALARRPRALLIGCDCPALTPEALRDAERALAAGAALVFAPAVDGGYALVGAARLDRTVFEDVPWGTSRVMEATRARLRALGWRWSELAPVRDVDRVQDLDLLPPDLRDGFADAPAPIF